MRYHECLVILIRGTHTGIQLESGPWHTSTQSICSDAATTRTARLQPNLLTSSLSFDAFDISGLFWSKHVGKYYIVDDSKIKKNFSKTAKVYEGKGNTSSGFLRKVPVINYSYKISEVYSSVSINTGLSHCSEIYTHSQTTGTLNICVTWQNNHRL